MLAKDIKPGMIVTHSDAPTLVETVSVQTPSARGGATLYKMRVRNMLTKQKTDLTLKGTESIEDADFGRRDVKLMYIDDAEVHFLDQEDYNQYTLPKEDVAEEMKYITEELEGINALIYNGACIGVQLPQAVALKVKQCDPAARGNSATARVKPATMETGLVVNVPEYLKEGETIKVDTRSGEFLSRA